MKKAIHIILVFLMLAVVQTTGAKVIRDIEIDFVSIGDPGNPPDGSGYGSVSREFDIGAYEISNAQWDQFVAEAGGINDSAFIGPNVPVGNVSWYEVVQFCNYLTSGDRSKGVYQFSGNIAEPGDFLGIDRAAAETTYGTIFFLPTENEWYKAAYYRPVTDDYSLYPNGSDTLPPADDGWNYKYGNYNGPWDGGTGTQEQNGTYDMAGNMWEWTETRIGAQNQGVSRGGSFASTVSALSSETRISNIPSSQFYNAGFRVAAYNLNEPAERMDFGDAPETEKGTYPTLESSNGARHIIGGPWFGTNDDVPDPDEDGQLSAAAAGDDNDGRDDEDGVHVGTLTAGRNAIVSFRVGGGGGVVCGWIDFNGNSRWDSIEQVVSGYYPDGVHSVVIDVPRRAEVGQTFARFRIGGKTLEPTGLADSGEVEDHRVVIKPYTMLDHFEPNNKISQAVDLGAFGQKRVGLGIHESGDEDWYRWTAASEETLRVVLGFQHADGDLQLEMYDSVGELIAVSQSSDDGARLTVKVVPDEVYSLRVLGVGPATNPRYTLETLLGDSENYAVLFSGGIRTGANYDRYYDNVKNLYELLVDEYSLDPNNIYVLYADGTDPDTDLDSLRDGIINSDMSYAQNVLSGTRDNLEDVLTNVLAEKIDLNDYFFLWTFDHGGGTRNDPDEVGEEVLCGWGDDDAFDVTADELADWLEDIRAGHQTVVFAQCYAGGMLAALEPLGGNMHGCSASNHYEPSWGDGFAAAYLEGLRNHNNGHDAYEYAYSHDAYATDGEGPSGEVAAHVEHPWESTGTSFPVFYEQTLHLPWIEHMRPIRHIPPLEEKVIISHDTLRAAANAGDPESRGLSFRIESVSSGVLLKEGRPVVPGKTLVGPGETLHFRLEKSASKANTMPAPGQVFTAFTVRVHDGVSVSDQAVSVPLVFTDDWPAQAVDDAVSASEDSVDVFVDVLSNDKGEEPLSVTGVGSATHGTARLESGKVLYTPAPEYSGSDSFTYFMATASGDADWAVVSVEIKAENDPPEAYSDRFVVLADSVDNIIDVLNNDFDAESKQLTYFIEQSGPYPISAVIIQKPSNGTLEPTEDGRFLYAPKPGFTGDDIIKYKADDGDALSEEAETVIRVISCPEPSPDFDHSGMVDAEDLQFFSHKWLVPRSSEYWEVRDLDCDGIVRWPDFAIFAMKWLDDSRP